MGHRSVGPPRRRSVEAISVAEESGTGIGMMPGAISLEFSGVHGDCGSFCVVEDETVRPRPDRAARATVGW